MSDRLKLILFLLLGLWLRLLWMELPPFQQLNAAESGVGLVARHILNGEFTAVGVETYLLSFFFLLFGASASVARFLPVCLALLSLVSLYCLGKTLFNSKIALRAVLFLAVGPLFLLKLSITPGSGNWMTLVLGPWIILWTYNVLFRKQRITRIGWRYFGIGFLSGLLMWQERVGLSFLIPSLLLFVFCERKFFFRPSFWLVGIGFALGVLPLLGLDPTLNWRMFFHRDGFLPFLSQIPSLFSPQQKWGEPLFWLLYFPVGLFLVVLIGRTLKSLWQREKGEWEGGRFLFVYLLSSIYVVLPLLIVSFWSRLGKKFSKIATTAFVLLISMNAAGSFLFARSVWQEPRRPIDALLTVLNEKKISSVMGDSHLVWPIAFESKEKIAAVDWNIFDEKRGEAVLTSENTAYVTEVVPLEAIVKNLGGTYSVKEIGGHTLFYQLSPPQLEMREVALENNALKKPISLRKILLQSGERISQLPVALEIEVSSDGQKWKKCVATSAGMPAVDWYQDKLFFNQKGEFAFYVSEEKVRFLRLKQAESQSKPWSWAEVRVYEENPKSISFSEEELFAALKQVDWKSVAAVYPPDSFLFQFKKIIPESCSLPNLFEPKTTSFENQSHRVDFTRRNAFLVADEETPFLNLFLRSKSIPYSVQEIKPKFSLVVTEPLPWVPSMLWSRQRLLSYFSEKESLAYLEDGDREWNQKRIGLAKKYYESAFEKFPSPATYACLKRVLQHLHDKKGLEELEKRR